MNNNYHNVILILNIKKLKWQIKITQTYSSKFHENNDF